MDILIVFFSEYRSLVNYENINISNLWQILEYEIIDIYKNYKNNIELNFINRLAINRVTNKKLKLGEFNNRIKIMFLVYQQHIPVIAETLF